jgi:hypothetical protein
MSKLDRVLACALVLCGLLVCAPSARSAVHATKENTCVQCHTKLSGGSFVGVKSHAWKGSVHQQHHVTCDKCHGGHPSASGKKQAHAGMLSSSNPKSPVYYKNIPATCGKCHGAEYYKFSQSLHYKMLEKTGKGPECVTCHGSMVTKILSPDTLAAVCEQCHNQRMGIFPYVPQKAKAVLLLLRESRELLAADEALHHPAKGTAQAKALDNARMDLYSARLDWHRFDLDTIINHLEHFHDAVKKLSPADPQH